MKAKKGLFVMALLLASMQARAAAPEAIKLADAKTMKYECAGGYSMLVTYWSASNGQHFASLPVDGKTLWFVDTFSGSGVRYQAGRYSWWEKGSTANLYDETAGSNAVPAVAGCTSTN
jgi:membrane-bound inhibitor of C-type lysozyme